MRSSVISIVVWLAGWVFAGAIYAAEGLPEGVPDYAGVNLVNFWEGGRYRTNNPHGDYVMPVIDPSKAFVVSPNGDDANPGSLHRPFKTLTRACREIRPGTVILLRDGRYYVDGLALQGAKGQRGTKEQPVLIAGFPGEKAVLTSAIKITGWQQVGDSRTYKASLSGGNAIEVEALWANGTILPTIRSLLYYETRDRKYAARDAKPLDEGPEISRPGAWATDGKTIYLHLPGDKNPNGAAVEASALRSDAKSSLYLDHTENIVFDRLVLEKSARFVTSMVSSNITFRYCVFNRNRYGYTGHGGDRVERDFLDRCLFEFCGGEFRGANAYFTRPVTVRHCLFRENTPNSSCVTAYTSKADGFSGTHVIGNTMVHGGACIHNTSRNAVIRDNVALGSRFLSNNGTGCTIENNLAVYDPTDLERYPKIPRRNIGFRAYGRDFKMTRNRFVGFAAGGNLYATEPAGAKRVDENGFYGYSSYVMRFFQLDGLTCERNLFVPVDAKALFMRITFKGQPKIAVDMEAWRKRGFGTGSEILLQHDPPPLPTVIQDAMKTPPARMPPR